MTEQQKLDNMLVYFYYAKNVGLFTRHHFIVKNKGIFDASGTKRRVYYLNFCSHKNYKHVLKVLNNLLAKYQRENKNTTYIAKGLADKMFDLYIDSIGKE